MANDLILKNALSLLEADRDKLRGDVESLLDRVESLTHAAQIALIAMMEHTDNTSRTEQTEDAIKALILALAWK